ncbi:MAG: ATP synthase F1 subunit delta [Bdellovibrionales bacterium]|nr:ATP synthase F1 subunit delta [Bdellovibrionales bacterium]
MQDRVAKIYAKAILDLGQKGKELHTIQEELASIGALVDENQELSLVFSSELFRTEDRMAVMESLYTKLKCNEVTGRILKLLASSNRVKNLSAIARELHLLVSRAENIVPLRVESRDELGSAQQKKIEERFEKFFGKPVEADFEVNPSLYGGVRVTAEGTTYDGTLATRLARMKETLVGGA